MVCGNFLIGITCVLMTNQRLQCGSDWVAKWFCSISGPMVSLACTLLLAQSLLKVQFLCRRFDLIVPGMAIIL